MDRFVVDISKGEWFVFRLVVSIRNIGFMVRFMMRFVMRFVVNIRNITVVWLMSWIWFWCEVFGYCIMFRLRCVIAWCRWLIAWCRWVVAWLWSMVLIITRTERSK